MKRILKDFLGNTIEITQTPKRIISLCPSITETLCDIGLHKFIVGRTDFCIHPQKYIEKIATVGGPKSINLNVVKELNPDIIFASKDENDKETIKTLSKDFNCFVFDVNSIDESIKMIKTLGEIFIIKCDVDELIHNIQKYFSELPKLKKNYNTLYLVWNNPYIAAGKNTYIDSLLSFVGFTNCIEADRYITLSVDTSLAGNNNNLKTLKCDLILLPSEPYKFTEQDKSVIQKIHPDAKILLVDGEMFCWYGSHMLKSAVYLKNLVKELNS